MPRRDDPSRALVSQLPSELLLAASRESRTAYRIAVGGWALLGLIGVLAGLRFFLEGPNSGGAVSRELNGPFDEAWSAAWMIGGALVIYGVLRPKWVIELYGQIIFTFALVPYIVAVWTIAGLVVALYLSLAIMGASMLRIWYLVRYAGRASFILEPGVSTVSYGRRKDDEPTPPEGHDVTG